MDTAQWPQGIGVEVVKQGMESVVGRSAQQPAHMVERRAGRPQKEAALNCPRCNSTNTKFCYYNNYSLSQPRYFCKTCRRYWTEGGSLRNVPVGGGSRKNKRSTSTSAAASAPPPTSSPNSTLLSSNTNTNTLLPQGFSAPPDHHQHLLHPGKIMIHAAGADLNLAYPTPPSSTTNPFPNPTSSHMSAMELLKMNSFPEMPVSVSGSGSGGGGIFASPMGFGLAGADYKPASASAAVLDFSLDGGFGSGGGGGGGYVNQEGVQERGGGSACRLLFPFEDLKQQQQHHHHHHEVATAAADHHHRHPTQVQLGHSRGGGHHGDNANTAPAYWNGMIGTGGSW